MSVYLINAEAGSAPVDLSNPEQLIDEMFGEGVTPVTEPWRSHGPVLVNNGIAFFNGDLNDPNNMCGNSPLKMKLLSMQPIGICPADGLQSYMLVPDTSSELPPG